jgi:hypothetical protein
MKHKTAAPSGRQEDPQWGPQVDPQTGGHKVSSRVSHQAPENEWQDIVEDLTLPQIKEYIIKCVYQLNETASVL